MTSKSSIFEQALGNTKKNAATSNPSERRDNKRGDPNFRPKRRYL